MDQLPFLVPETRNLGDLESANLFTEGKAASTFSGYWLFDAVTHNPNLPPEICENFGIAKFPMPAFVGGSHLIIWKNSHNIKEAIELVEHLTSRKTQNVLSQHLSQIPARNESLKDSFSSQNSNDRAILESLKTGRTFSAPYMWGMVEARLLPIIVGTWQELFANPKINLEDKLYQRLDALANRLSVSFSSR